MASSVTPPADGDETTQPLNKSWIVGPVIGSVLGVATVFIVIYYTRRKHLREALFALEAARAADIKDIKEEDDAGDDSGESTQGLSQLHSEDVEMRELETHEIHELPAVEPVGPELSTPRDETMDPNEAWPLPVTPLRAMFAMAEIRDEKAGCNGSPTHDTYYNP